jgi:hypothetical protein
MVPVGQLVVSTTQSPVFLSHWRDVIEVADSQLALEQPTGARAIVHFPVSSQFAWLHFPSANTLCLAAVAAAATLPGREVGASAADGAPPRRAAAAGSYQL